MKIIKSLLLLLICISFGLIQAQSQEGELIKEKLTSSELNSKCAQVDDIFSSWDNDNTPGAAIGIIKDGELIYSNGYGLANMEYNIPNTDSTVFRIASVSKQFTAACIVLLAEQGRLSLDDRLIQFFPEFPEYAKNISIRHLLNHTSGIRDYGTIWYLKGRSNNEYYSNKDIMNMLLNQSELNFLHPGDEYMYCNSGYWLLGQIVEQVADINMADFAEKEIFKPLGMSDTHFHNDDTRIVKNRASGYLVNDDNTYQIGGETIEVIADKIGDGGIFTTIKDIKKWDDAFYDKSVLSKEFWNIMIEPGTLNNGKKIQYACGLYNWKYNGLNALSHGGMLSDFRSNFIRFPNQRFSVAVFTNRGDRDPSLLARQIADIFLEDEFAEAAIKIPAKDDIKQPDNFHLDTTALEKFAGYYWSDESMHYRTLYVKNDTLRYQRSETSESTLVPISNNEFKMINVGIDVVIKFEKNKFGNQIMSFIEKGEEPYIFFKWWDKSFSKSELDDLAGTYYSKDLDVSYVIKSEDNSLVLYINKTKYPSFRFIYSEGYSRSLTETRDKGQPGMTLFWNDDYGRFKFMTDKNGKAYELRYADGWLRVKNLKFEKK